MNKAALRTQFLGLLNRNDCDTPLADTFIDMGLARIQRTLRVPAMEKAQTIGFSTAVPDSFVLPSDFLEFIDLYAEHNKLRQVPMGTFLGASSSGTAPQVYTRFGADVGVKPAPQADQKLTLLYYAEIPDFTDDASSNWLSTVAPDLLVYASLTYAADYFVDERKPAFEQNYVSIFNDITEQARMLEFSGGEMLIQPAYNLDF